jgi:hypothetical protein
VKLQRVLFPYDLQDAKPVLIANQYLGKNVGFFHPVSQEIFLESGNMSFIGIICLDEKFSKMD